MKIGIDLGGSHIAVGAINDEAKIIAKEEENILLINKEQEVTKELIRDKILSLINSLKQKLQMPAFIIDEIGIGVPGIVENNIIKKCEKYGIYNWDLAKELRECYKINVKLSNDAIACAKAEVCLREYERYFKVSFYEFGYRNRWSICHFRNRI